MRTPKLILLFLTLSLSKGVLSQYLQPYRFGHNSFTQHVNIGVGTARVTATSAWLEIGNSTGGTKGFLPPRLTTTERDAIPSPATWLTIVNKTTGRWNFYNGSAWVEPGAYVDSVFSRNDSLFYIKNSTNYFVKKLQPFGSYITLTGLSATSPVLYNNTTGVFSLDTASGKWRSENYYNTIYTPLTRSIATGYGLSGGGDFSIDRTHLLDSAVLFLTALRRKDSLTVTNLLGYVTRTILADSAAAIRATIGGGGYSDEQAQDAVGAMIDASLTYVDGTPLLQRAALTGDVTASAGGNATTLATVNSNVGTFTNAIVTVNGKGLVTAAANGTAPVTTVTATSPITSSGGTTPNISTSMATGSLIYRKTAGTGVMEVNTLATLKTDLGLTGTNTGDQTYQQVMTTGSTLTGNNTIVGGGFTYAFTNGRFTTPKGANVAAANDLTLGADGNLFTITGNTTINAVTSTNWQAGSEIRLYFTGTPLLKNNTAGGGGTSKMQLSGAADYTVAAGDIITLIYDGTDWREAARILAAVATGTVPLSSITAAINSNAISNAAYQQTWDWNTLAAGTGLRLISTSTSAASGSQTIFSVEQSGVNGTAGQATYAQTIFHTKTGTTSENIGSYISVSGGANRNDAIEVAAGRVYLRNTTEQIRTAYDASNYFTTTVNSTGNPTFNAVGTSPEFTFSDAVNVPDEAYGAGWNGNTEVPTKNALYDKIETLGGSGITIGTTTITSGTNTRVLFNNSGIVGEYTISGTGNVAMTTSPTFTTPALGTPSSGTVTNLTGTASININGTVGATTPTTGTFTTGQVNTGLVPDADGGAYLGTGTLGFSSIFLASASVINFANSNATITHSTGILTSNVPFVIPGETYGAGWDADNGAATKNDIYDKIETIGGISGSGTANYVTYWSGTSALTGSSAFQFTGQAIQLTSTNTTQATTSAALYQNYSSLTSGDGQYMVANALSSGNILHISSNGSAGVSGQNGVYVSLAGAYSGSSQTSASIETSNTHTGTSSINYGSHNTASGGASNYAVRGIASGASATDNIGGYFSATGSGATTNTGLFATASGGTTNIAGLFDGNVGIGAGASFPSERLHVSGNAIIEGQLYSAQYALTDGATIAINFNNGNTQKVTLGGNRTITFSNPKSGAKYLIHLKQDGTGSRTITWPTIKWQGGTTPTLTTTANKSDLIFITYDGTDYFGEYSLNF